MKYLSVFSTIILTIFFSCTNGKKSDLNQPLSGDTISEVTIEDNADLVSDADAELTSIDSIKKEKDESGLVDLSSEQVSDPEVQPTAEKQQSVHPPKTERKSKKKPRSEIKFYSDSYDFGRIVMDEVVRHEFKFINKGNAALTIQDAEASCGCTRPIFPFIPIEPGKEGSILVEFNSKGRLGRQSASIEVKSNGNPNKVTLQLTGEVVTEEFGDSI